MGIGSCSQSAITIPLTLSYRFDIGADAGMDDFCEDDVLNQCVHFDLTILDLLSKQF